MSDTSSQDMYTYEASFGDYFALLKPRVMSLVVFTAFVGYFVAPTNLHPFEGFVAILAIALGAGASGALNMWYDADIDSVMKRTKSRPVPSGRVSGEEARIIGITLSAFAVVFLGLAANWVAAGLLAFTIFFYAVVYTMYLKRATPQNIVIGGAAGAFPPMVGWVAATGSFSIDSVLMFTLIFLWTPPHFWALALFMRSDYDDAGVPMLTVTHGRPATRRHIFGYTVILAVFALGLCFLDIAGPLYIVAAVTLNAVFLVGAYRIMRRDEDMSEADNFAVERKFFKWSLVYLFAHFGALAIDAVLARTGLWAMVVGA